jgi:hypothetical protein
MTKRLFVLFVAVIAIDSRISAVEVNPGYTGEPGGIQESEESRLRRGEVVFFISYPFTFLGSLAVYSLAGSGMRSLEAGKSDFSPTGAGFFGLVAVTAAFFSFGIAMNDYQAIQSETRSQDGKLTEYLSFSTRF